MFFHFSVIAEAQATWQSQNFNLTMAQIYEKIGCPSEQPILFIVF